MDFKNKIVIVTGGAQGIGRCIAEEFEKLGATVCVIDKPKSVFRTMLLQNVSKICQYVSLCY